MYDWKMKRISEHWAKEPDFVRTFYGFPPFQAYIRSRITGQSEEWEYIFLLRQLLSDRLPVPRALSIFCGHGENEIRLAQSGVFQQCLALDVSAGAIDHARRVAIQQGVTNVQFQCQDLNLPDVLPPNEFDLVIANGALHHAMDLRGLLTQVKRSMKPNTLFVSSEYVGPDRFGKTFRQQSLIRAMRTLIPLSLRHDRTNKLGARLKGYVRRMVSSATSTSQLIFQVLDAIQRLRVAMHDPSEAVHSSLTWTSQNQRGSDLPGTSDS